MSSPSSPVRLIAAPDGGVTPGDIPTKESPVEQLQRSRRLVVGDFMAGLVDTGEGEVAELAGFAELDAIDEEGRVACFAEVGAVGVVHGEGDGFAAEPVADVVCVAVNEGDADGEAEEGLEVVDEVGPDEVAGLLEGVEDFVVGLGVVDVDADGVQDVVFFEVVFVVGGWGWVLGTLLGYM